MSKTTTEMRMIPTDKLVPYVDNARTHSADQVKKLQSSLREFDFINPIIIDRDFSVITGHDRLLAAKAEGITYVKTAVDFSELKPGIPQISISGRYGSATISLRIRNTAVGHRT